MSDTDDVDQEQRILIELAKHALSSMVDESTVRGAVGLDSNHSDRHKFEHFMTDLKNRRLISRHRPENDYHNPRAQLTDVGRAFLVTKKLI